MEDIPAGREPHEQRLPLGVTFSAVALSQLHSPAGRARHEHRGPSILFSVAAFSQVQLRADWLPHEQVACVAVKESQLEKEDKRDLGTWFGKPTTDAFSAVLAAACRSLRSGHCDELLIGSRYTLQIIKLDLGCGGGEKTADS